MIREWDTVALEQLEQVLSARITVIDDVRRRITGLGGLCAWKGEAAEAARHAFQVTVDDLTDEGASIGTVRQVTAETFDAVTHVKMGLSVLMAAADDNAFTVSDAGVVTDAPTQPERSPHDVAIRATFRADLEVSVKALILQAENIDADAARVLVQAYGGIDSRGARDVDAAVTAGEQHGALSAPTPPQNGSPLENRKYWASMPESERGEVLEHHPEWVGARDGIPAAARHQANVNQFDDERARLTSERDRLKSILDHTMFGGVFTNDDAALWYTEQKLRDLDVVEQIVAKNPDGKLMLLDLTSGERGMAAFAVGDPDTADHISVTTPGLNTTIVDSFEGMVGEARSLGNASVEQLRLQGRAGESVATIAWLGYEPPQTMGPGKFDTVRGLLDVTQSDRAVAGASRLAAFFEGVNVASRQSDPHLIALGHSYGSYTTGLALQDPRSGHPVDDAVFYGSPGINADDESDLGLREGHGYVMEADEDRFVTEVGRTHRFGPDPGTASFEQLSVEEGMSPDGTHRGGVLGHSEYPHEGTMSAYNMSAIVAGLPERVVR
ncbi:alpha/beta hydrolase [Rhodococcus tibetensis]|uniref:Alpha/beta hydrolase family protein n=1 Tax=Rhodococcus tibetensis TaxID=2965064 RepID=A0ABT1QHE3_9NOCA|nr:alpha/beta hydrolase [Rhodococcus sp. FXJ9.536]MCQ4121670.1 alpha/beta hydrolase family protein [Rhodococcus sp. FXJ9.536]